MRFFILSRFKSPSAGKKIEILIFRTKHGDSLEHMERATPAGVKQQGDPGDTPGEWRRSFSWR